MSVKRAAETCCNEVADDILFNSKFNFKLRHHHLMHGKWHKNTLNEALTTLHHDKELQRFCKTLLQDIDMVNHQGVNVESSSCEIFDMFCRKFCKRRCVTFLAVDGLNFKNEEQSSAIRQMLRCLDKQVVKNVKATDKCFKCGEEGHWANKCKKDIPHDQAWLLKQQCYTCGQYGHFKADCKLHEKASGIKNSGTAGYSKKKASELYDAMVLLKGVQNQSGHKGQTIDQVGRRQQQRQIKEIREKAQKALWFADTYGLSLKYLNMEDSSGRPIDVNLNSADAQSSTRAGETVNDETYTTAPHQPESASYHELSQAQPSLPKKYLVEGCAKFLDSQWEVKRTPGQAQGAELPVKILLEMKFDIM
ncbi:hypothetical protein OS493_007020 [Desmophyllum pertusum]|uniref:CCHC-type domain-containing protein n=1 Tax=Desmophyllum pertusum TaxID=174260 RepID=A0A9X0CYX4_9CNID|nr:hypothetical protein OS493_007020 [Desmophyllum pertusum]